MYEEHPSFETPPWDAVLWRYMDFEKFVSLLDQRALFFAKVSELGDPFEGSITKPIQKWIDKSMDNPKDVHKYLIERRSRMLVNCWHEGDYESEAMWHLYGKSIAIRTTSASLCSSFIGEVPVVRVGWVRYADYNKTDMRLENFFDLYLLKRLSFKHEQEVRAIVSTDTDYTPVEGKGMYCDVNLETLIEQVVVAPDSPEWFMDLVKSVSKRYNLEVPVLQSNLEDSPLF